MTELDQLLEENSPIGGACIKKIEAVPTSLWCNGWYKNPSSGRSHNYGVTTEKPQEHYTVIVKGGSFFVAEKFKNAFVKKKLSLPELYGGISFETAKKEFDIAKLIQGKFESLLNKKANCPQPIGVNVATSIVDENGSTIELIDFFQNIIKEERKKSEGLGFTATNFLTSAGKLGIDVMYPLSGEAPAEIKKQPFHWVFNQCLEKSRQSVYKYKIEGPNTRLLDLMTQHLPDRQKHFLKANNATDIRDALEIFASKLGEFYGVLHKSNISYHGGSSEHCTLIDTTVAGVVMDIGGLSENSNAGVDSEAYIAQIFKTTNLIAYLCSSVFIVDETVLKNTMDAFWNKYKGIYSDGNIEFFSEERSIPVMSDKIRTKYFDNTSDDWIKLAPDLEYLLHTD